MKAPFREVRNYKAMYTPITQYSAFSAGSFRPWSRSALLPMHQHCSEERVFPETEISAQKFTDFQVTGVYQKFLFSIAGFILMIFFGIGSAMAACSGSVISGLASPNLAAYDPLNAAAQSQDFSLTIQNTSGASCVLSVIAFADPVAVTLANGANSLTYGISHNGIVSDIRNAKPTAGSQVKAVSFAGNNSSLLTWDFFVDGGQMLPAGVYSDSTAEIRAYEHLDGDANNFADANLSLRDSITVNATATMSESCNLPATVTANITDNATYTGGLSGDINFSGAIDSTDASLNAATLELTYSNTSCNYAATVTVNSQNGGMTKQSGSTAINGSFLSRIDYKAEATFCDRTVTIQTGGTAISNNAVCASSGINTTDLVISLKTVNGSTPLLQGLYKDILTVKIGSPL